MFWRKKEITLWPASLLDGYLCDLEELRRLLHSWDSAGDDWQAHVRMRTIARSLLDNAKRLNREVKRWT